MKKLKLLWNENKKACLIYGGIGILSLIIIIVTIIILISVFRRFDYPKVEKMMVDATKNYLKAHSELVPLELNDEVVIDVDSLVSEKYLKELSKLSKDTACGGAVTVINNEKQLRYLPSLECTNYKTTSLSETILNRETIMEEKAGLYNINDYYTYRGEYVNNYINYMNYSWRILKFDEDNMYLVLSDTLNSKTMYIYDDRFNESINSYRGKNNFEDSRIELSLQDLYDGFFKDQHAILKVMDACTHTRSEMDTDKAGNIECHTTYPTPISLLSVYDYMNASIDPLCITSVSRNCSNYNYLAKTKNKYWLLNGTNENSYDVYYVGTNGAIDLDFASQKKDLRIVIAIPSNIVYKNGIGTSSEPFTFYEY